MQETANDPVLPTEYVTKHLTSAKHRYKYSDKISEELQVHKSERPQTSMSICTAKVRQTKRRISSRGSCIHVGNGSLQQNGASVDVVLLVHLSSGTGEPG